MLVSICAKTRPIVWLLPQPPRVKITTSICKSSSDVICSCPSKVIAQISTWYPSRVPVRCTLKDCTYTLETQQKGQEQKTFHCDVQLGICNTSFSDKSTANPSFGSPKGEILKIADCGTISTNLETKHFSSSKYKTSKQKLNLHSAS